MLVNAIKFWLMPRLRKFRRDHSENGKISYSQCGEDMILQHLFRVLGMDEISYLDLGAHHPTYLSNTYLFYKSGGRGVCVEPDPGLIPAFLEQRPHDIHLNCGVGTAAAMADFYLMSTPTLNTFSKVEAERYQSYGKQRIQQVVQLELKPVNDIIEHYFPNCPNLVSLDVEGMDFAIMQSFDFARYRPAVFCLETLSYTEDHTAHKLTELIELMHSNGYLTYADTYINTIFVDKRTWENRPC